MRPTRLMKHEQGCKGLRWHACARDGVLHQDVGTVRSPTRDGGEVMDVRLFFAWYDAWVGLYFDRKARALYVCPLPFVVLRFAPSDRTSKGGEK